MRHRSPRTFGLSLLAVLGLLAAMAASAQAGPDWLIKDPGPPVTDELAPGFLPFFVEHDTLRGLQASIFKVDVEILCEESSVEKGGLEEEGRLSGIQLLDECTTLLNGVEAAACEVKTQPISLAFKGQAFEHGGTGYVLISPQGTSYGSVVFSPECSIGEKLALTGSLVLRDCNNDFPTYLVRHLLEQAVGALFASGEHVNSLKLGSSSATSIGSDWYKLPSGREWKWMA